MKRLPTPINLLLPVTILLFTGCRAAETEELYVYYCSNYRYTRYYHPELKSVIADTLHQICLKIPDPTQSNAKCNYQYKVDPPLLYASSFCQMTAMEKCQHCLQLARRTLLHGCRRAIGGEFYSETCAMRFELYKFYT